MGQRSFANIRRRGGCHYKFSSVSFYFEGVLCKGVFATKSYEELILTQQSIDTSISIYELNFITMFVFFHRVKTVTG